MFAIEFLNLVTFSYQLLLFPDQLEFVASLELHSKLPVQWQHELDRLHQEDGCRAMFMFDKEWCLQQECNDKAFAACKEMQKVSAPIEEKKEKQQNHTKPTGSVNKVQCGTAPQRGSRLT